MDFHYQLACSKFGLAIALYLVLFFFAGCEAKHVIFVVDRSASICENKQVLNCENWEYMLRFLDGIVKDLDVGTGFGFTRVGVVVYADKAAVEISLSDIDNTPDLRVAISDIDYLPNGGRNISGGILLMMQQFQEHNQPYFATEIAVLITDGQSTIDSEDTIASGIEAKNKGITVFVIGITGNVDYEEIRQISSDPQLLGVNFFISPTFEALEHILDSVRVEFKPGKWYEYLATECILLQFHEE